MTDYARTIDRKQFLRGDFSAARPVLRPPWSLPEDAFTDACERCGDCVAACEEKILRPGRGGFPVVDFSHGGCSFCAACLKVCNGRALRGDSDHPESAWSLKADIDGDCLAHKSVECRSCGEHCDVNAIRFRLAVGGAARPLLDTERCNGCGECHAVCPVRAIRLAPAKPLKQAV